MHHPAHFHLYKNVVRNLKAKGNTVIVVCQKKDVLDNLLLAEGFEYINLLPKGRKDNKLSMLISLLRQDIGTLKICLKHKPDILFGTSGEICHIGKLLKIPSLYFNEDDIDVVPLLKYLVYPFAKHIVTPNVCETGKFEKKTIKYNSYHELAYLHPNNFTPDFNIVKKTINPEKPYCLIRFAKLTAHHDKGINGISTDVAEGIISLLSKKGSVYISSERELESKFEKYRISIDPIYLHHVMAFADLYIGDSQTMAAESGVLGVPFIRYNDFVGRIGYLEELENTYKLGYGIKPNNQSALMKTLKDLLDMPNRQNVFQQRRNKMLEDKIDLASYITDLLSNYPHSLKYLSY
jgi:predicted glycosyltransferase